MLPMLFEAVKGGGNGLFGKEGQEGSTYNQGQLGANQDILGLLKNMMSGGQGDITQNQNYQQGSDWLSSLFNDQDFFNKFEAPLQRQYEEQTIPDLANRFAGMGSGGSFGGDFRNQLAREGSNLSTNIAALRGGMQQQGANQALQYAQQPFNNMASLYQSAMGTPTNNVYRPATPGFAGNVGGNALSGFMSGYGQQYGQDMAKQNNGITGNNQVSLGV